MFSFFSGTGDPAGSNLDVDERLHRIERKLGIILVLVAVQLAITVLGAIGSWLIPSFPTVLMMLIAVGVFAYIFRRQLPGWIATLTKRDQSSVGNTTPPPFPPDSKEPEIR